MYNDDNVGYLLITIIGLGMFLSSVIKPKPKPEPEVVSSKYTPPKKRQGILCRHCEDKLDDNCGGYIFDGKCFRGESIKRLIVCIELQWLTKIPYNDFYYSSISLADLERKRFDLLTEVVR